MKSQKGLTNWHKLKCEPPRCELSLAFSGHFHLISKLAQMHHIIITEPLFEWPCSHDMTRVTSGISNSWPNQTEPCYRFANKASSLTHSHTAHRPCQRHSPTHGPFYFGHALLPNDNRFAMDTVRMVPQRARYTPELGMHAVGFVIAGDVLCHCLQIELSPLFVCHHWNLVLG